MFNQQYKYIKLVPHRNIQKGGENVEDQLPAGQTPSQVSKSQGSPKLQRTKAVTSLPKFGVISPTTPLPTTTPGLAPPRPTTPLPTTTPGVAPTTTIPSEQVSSNPYESKMEFDRQMKIKMGIIPMPSFPSLITSKPTSIGKLTQLIKDTINTFIAIYKAVECCATDLTKPNIDISTLTEKQLVFYNIVIGQFNKLKEELNQKKSAYNELVKTYVDLMLEQKKFNSEEEIFNVLMDCMPLITPIAQTSCYMMEHIYNETMKNSLPIYSIYTSRYLLSCKEDSCCETNKDPKCCDRQENPDCFTLIVAQKIPKLRLLLTEFKNIFSDNNHKNNVNNNIKLMDDFLILFNEKRRAMETFNQKHFKLVEPTTKSKYGTKIIYIGIKDQKFIENTVSKLDKQIYIKK